MRESEAAAADVFCAKAKRQRQMFYVRKRSANVATATWFCLCESEASATWFCLCESEASATWFCLCESEASATWFYLRESGAAAATTRCWSLRRFHRM
ncbi:hypothetical protein [Lysinibacillus sp. TE18511]